MSERHCPNFGVSVKPEEDVYAVLSITHNGSQWTGIALHNYDEFYALISSLESYLKRKEKDRR